MIGKLVGIKDLNEEPRRVMVVIGGVDMEIGLSTRFSRLPSAARDEKSTGLFRYFACEVGMTDGRLSGQPHFAANRFPAKAGNEGRDRADILIVLFATITEKHIL